jgi:hypothetical protein
MLLLPVVVDLTRHLDNFFGKKYLWREDLFDQRTEFTPAHPLGCLDHRFEIFHREPLHHTDDPQPLILHETFKGVFAPPEVHQTHYQDETDEDGANEGNGEGLHKGPVVSGGTVLPDDLFFRAHTMGIRDRKRPMPQRAGIGSLSPPPAGCFSDTLLDRRHMNRCATAPIAAGNPQQYSGVIIGDSPKKSTISFPMTAERRAPLPDIFPVGIGQESRIFAGKGRDFTVHWLKRDIREAN